MQIILRSTGRISILSVCACVCVCKLLEGQVFRKNGQFNFWNHKMIKHSIQNKLSWSDGNLTLKTAPFSHCDSTVCTVRRAFCLFLFRTTAVLNLTLHVFSRHRKFLFSFLSFSHLISFFQIYSIADWSMTYNKHFAAVSTRTSKQTIQCWPYRAWNCEN